MGASGGQIIVPVASPVFYNDVFWGVAATSVKLEPLLDRFAGNMRISDKTNIFLIDQQKNVLYSTTGSTSINDNLKSSVSLDKEDQIYKDGRLIAYSPISLGEQMWSIIIVSPIRDVLSLGVPFYIRQIGILALAATTTFIFGVMVSRNKTQNKL